MLTASISGGPPRYHALVKRIARRNLERVNDGDYDALLSECAPGIRHRFGGNHSLGGVRNDEEAVRAWFQRLGRLFPSLRLTVTDVWVSGLPHDTTVVLRWNSATTLPDGSPYTNHGVHVIRMRWFKAVEIDANEDSQAVADALAVIAAHGVDEALAAPITS